jgi:hypothetical protein
LEEMAGVRSARGKTQRSQLRRLKDYLLALRQGRCIEVGRITKQTRAFSHESFVGWGWFVEIGNRAPTETHLEFVRPLSKKFLQDGEGLPIALERAFHRESVPAAQAGGFFR